MKNVYAKEPWSMDQWQGLKSPCGTTVVAGMIRRRSRETMMSGIMINKIQIYILVGHSYFCARVIILSFIAVSLASSIWVLVSSPLTLNHHHFPPCASLHWCYLLPPFPFIFSWSFSFFFCKSCHVLRSSKVEQGSFSYGVCSWIYTVHLK